MARKDDQNQNTELNLEETTTEDTTTGTLDDGFEWEPELPKGGGGGQKSKYDWGAFPEPKDGKFPTKTYMGLKAPKPVYNSIKKYQTKLAEEGKEYPEFTVRAIKEGTGKEAKTVGVKVQRIK